MRVYVIYYSNLKLMEMLMLMLGVQVKVFQEWLLEIYYIYCFYLTFSFLFVTIL